MNTPELSQDELFRIADCGQKTALMEWLEENDIEYTLTRKGRIVTSREAFNARFRKNNVIRGDFKFGT